ncbi:hypothetical protein L573_3213, partial [Bordetella holmesii H620]
LKNQGSSVTAIKHGSTLFRDEPFLLAGGTILPRNAVPP